MCMYIWTYVNSEMYMMPQLWPMLATKISYMMNMLQYVYYFYACIECTYIAAILHILYSTMNISCHDSVWTISIIKEVKKAV